MDENKSTFTKQLKKFYDNKLLGSSGSYIDSYSTSSQEYTLEDVKEIISGNSYTSQQTLSYYFYKRDGFYRRIVLYYATLLNYTGILIPNPNYGKKLSETYIQKRYFQAVEYIDKLNLSEFFANISTEILVSGAYYGVITEANKQSLSIVGLPTRYCRSRFTDFAGNDIIEFDISYLNTFSSDPKREEILESYPDIIRNYYQQYREGKIKNRWVTLPSSIGFTFSFFDEKTPLFLSTIPAIMQYENTVEVEQERALEEIRKIIVQKIPHTNDGELLFEPPEAEVMHKGVVQMLKNNPYLSVMTTYADVDAVTSKTTSENVSHSIEKMSQNVYGEAGVSSFLFAPTSAQALKLSITNDISLMMALGDQYSRFLTNIVNALFGNSNIRMSYKILPISLYNQDEYITNSMKLAQSGYSFLLPALAMGLSQHELVNVKDLENTLLDLQEKLVPLASSYTQSSKESDDVGGAPKKEVDEKADKTIANEKSLEEE